MKNERIRKGILVGTILVLSVGIMSGCTPKSAREKVTNHVEVEMNRSGEKVSETTKGKNAKKEEQKNEETKKKELKKKNKNKSKKNKKGSGINQSTGGQKKGTSKKSNDISEDDCIGLEKAKSIAVYTSGIDRRKVYVESAYFSNNAYFITLGGDNDKEHIYKVDGRTGEVIYHTVKCPEDDYYEDEDDWDDCDDDDYDCDDWDDWYEYEDD